MKKIIIVLSIFLITINLYPQQVTIKLSEGFESSTFPPSGWRRFSPLGSNVWERKTVPLPPEIMQPPVQGNAVARINFDYSGGEDWLISKRIDSVWAGDSLLFYLIKQRNDGPFLPDSLIIKASTTDSLQASFTNILLKINVAGFPTGNQIWHRYSVPLTQFSGQHLFIAFQHKDVNGHGCALDSIVVFNPASIGIRKISSILPSKNELFQNYPNPFNPSTKIRFNIKEKSFVTLKVFDISGKEVYNLLNDNLNSGEYEIPFSINKYNNPLSTGIYFYRLETMNWKDLFIITKLMVFVK